MSEPVYRVKFQSVRPNGTGKAIRSMATTDRAQAEAWYAACLRQPVAWCSLSQDGFLVKHAGSPQEVRP